MTRLESALEWLAEQYEPVTSADTAAALGVALSTACELLRQAEKRGMAIHVGTRQRDSGRPFKLWVSS